MSGVRTGIALGFVGVLLIVAGCANQQEPTVNVIPASPIPTNRSGLVSPLIGGLHEYVVRTTDTAFSPSSIELGVGERVNLVLINDGEELHEFWVSGPGVHPVFLRVEPGAVDVGELHAEATGVYEVLCTVPGHAEQGHSATLVIEA